MSEVGVLFVKRGFFVVVLVDKGQLIFLKVVQNGLRYVTPLWIYLTPIFCKKFQSLCIERKKGFHVLQLFSM